MGLIRDRRALAVIAPFVGGVIASSTAGLGAQAGIVEIIAMDAGFVTEAGGSAKGDGTIVPMATYNYSVGWELHYSEGALFTPLEPMNRKNYFVFDLTGVTKPITKAAFVVNAGIYESPDDFEVLDLHAPGDPGAALADAAFLLDANKIGPTEFDEPTDPAIMVAMAMYGTLTDGPAIGSTMISAADDGVDIIISIDPDYLNGFLGKKVIFGGELATLEMMGTPEAAMGFTGPDIPGGDPLTPKLLLETIPTPGTAVVLFGAVLAGAYRRRRA